MNRFKQFAKSTGIYFIGSVMTKIISFCMLPVYTARISPDAMGYYNVSITCLNVVISVLCLEAWTTILRFMYDYKNRNDRYIAVTNGMALISGSAVLYLIVVTATGFLASPEHIILIGIYGFFMMMQSVYSSIARGLEYNTVFAVSGILGSVVNSLVCIILIFICQMQAEAIYIAGILGFLVQVVILEFRVRIIHSFKKVYLSADIIKKMLWFSLPLSLNAVSYWMLTGFNNVVISNTLGLEANGIYSVAARFSVIITTVATCFTMAWQELVYSRKGVEGGSFYTKASNHFMKFLAISVLGIIPVIYLTFPFIVKEAYRDAFSLIPLNLAAGAVGIASGFYGNIFSARKNTKVIFLAAFSAAIVNVTILLLFTKQLGSQAANVSLLCGFITDILIKLIILQKQKVLSIDIRLILIFVCAFILCCYVFFYGGVMGNLIFAILVLITTIIIFKDFFKQVITGISDKRSIKL